jgi:hypothetical protein
MEIAKPRSGPGAFWPQGKHHTTVDILRSTLPGLVQVFRQAAAVGNRQLRLMGSVASADTEPDLGGVSRMHANYFHSEFHAWNLPSSQLRQPLIGLLQARHQPESIREAAQSSLSRDCRSPRTSQRFSPTPFSPIPRDRARRSSPSPTCWVSSSCRASGIGKGRPLI